MLPFYTNIFSCGRNKVYDSDFDIDGNFDFIISENGKDQEKDIYY